jgi:hypothetical protein
MSNNQTYSIYAFGPGGEIPQGGYQLVSDARSKDIHTGKATNVYTATCKGNELTLVINGNLVAAVPTSYDLREGNIGIGFSSPKNLSVDVEFESVKVSRP